MSKILVVIDMQVEYIKKCCTEDVINNVIKKIETRMSEDYEIILTEDKSGGKIEESISKLCFGSQIFKKRSYASKELILHLRRLQPEIIEFVGICTDICVIANVLGTMAFLPYTDIRVDSSCCASYPEGHVAALKVMKSCNINVY